MPFGCLPVTRERENLERARDRWFTVTSLTVLGRSELRPLCSHTPAVPLSVTLEEGSPPQTRRKQCWAEIKVSQWHAAICWAHFIVVRDSRNVGALFLFLWKPFDWTGVPVRSTEASASSSPYDLPLLAVFSADIKTPIWV